MFRSIAAWLAVSLVGIGTAHGQTQGKPPVELGIAATGLFAVTNDGRRELLDGEQRHDPGVGFRLTLPISQRFGLEVFTTVGHRDAWYGSTVEGFLGGQLQHHLLEANDRRTQLFLTYGLTAYYRAVHHLDPAVLAANASAYAQQHGFVGCSVPCGDSTLGTSLYGRAGGGIQHLLSDRIALRVDVQELLLGGNRILFPMALQAAVGVSVPLRPYPQR